MTIWNRVEKSLPALGQTVLIVTVTEFEEGGIVRDVEQAEFTHDRQWVLFCWSGGYVAGDHVTVTHWRPMPLLPKD